MLPEYRKLWFIMYTNISYRWMRGIPLKESIMYIYIKSIYLILIDGGRIVLLRISDWTHDLLYAHASFHYSMKKNLNYFFYSPQIYNFTYYQSNINWITYQISLGLSFRNIYINIWNIISLNIMVFSELRKTFLSTYICKNLVASPLNWINV